MTWPGVAVARVRQVFRRQSGDLPGARINCEKTLTVMSATISLSHHQTESSWTHRPHQLVDLLEPTHPAPHTLDRGQRGSDGGPEGAGGRGDNQCCYRRLFRRCILPPSLACSPPLFLATSSMRCFLCLQCEEKWQLMNKIFDEFDEDRESLVKIKILALNFFASCIYQLVPIINITL
jgi:hypothetical protein